jgi:hypothetical protein
MASCAVWALLIIRCAPDAISRHNGFPRIKKDVLDFAGSN